MRAMCAQSDIVTAALRISEAVVANDHDQSTNDPFGVWLHNQLSAMYPEVLSEPLPDEMQQLAQKLEIKLAMVEKDRESKTGSLDLSNIEVDSPVQGFQRYGRSTT